CRCGEGVGHAAGFAEPPAERAGLGDLEYRDIGDLVSAGQIHDLSLRLAVEERNGAVCGVSAVDLQPPRARFGEGRADDRVRGGRAAELDVAAASRRDRADGDARTGNGRDREM